MRRPDETEREWAMFQHYLALGPGRRLERVASRFGLSVDRVKHISAEQGWTLRAAGYDADLERRAVAWMESSRRRRELLDASNREALARMVRLQIKRWLMAMAENPKLVMDLELLDRIVTNLNKSTSLESRTPSEIVQYRGRDPMEALRELRARGQA